MQKAVVKLSEDGIIMDTDNTYIINYIIYNTYIYIDNMGGLVNKPIRVC